jgi:ADP-ribose pyrophosphatase
MPSPEAVDPPRPLSRPAWSGRRIAVDLVESQDPAGGTVDREVVRHPGGAVILPLLDDGRIVLIRNHRVSIEETLWELPAGTRGPGEDLAEVAGRELEEETGFRAARIEPFGWFFTTPGFTDERIDAYLAEGLVPGPQRLEDGESIQVVPLPLDEVLRMIDDGRIRDAKTIAVVLRWWRRRGLEP